MADEKAKTIIKNIKGPNNEIYNNPQQILEQFVYYYRDLYTPENRSVPDDICRYLQTNPLNCIEDDQLDTLTSDITVAEIKLAVSALPTGMASGEDSILLELYKKCIEEQAPLFSMVVRHIGSGGKAPKSWNITQIIYFFFLKQTS